jgi:hypothetical protein
MKEDITRLIKELETSLSYAQSEWDKKEKSEAFIVGYLEGTIKYAISDLKIINKK